jgi:hypothetical protein
MGEELAFEYMHISSVVSHGGSGAGPAASSKSQVSIEGAPMLEHSLLTSSLLDITLFFTHKEETTKMETESQAKSGEQKPSKHSEEFFVNRIKELQDEIKENLLPVDSEAMQAFLAACMSMQSAADSREKAEELLKKL